VLSSERVQSIGAGVGWIDLGMVTSLPAMNLLSLRRWVHNVGVSVSHKKKAEDKSSVFCQTVV
jgi:hypothetical protein